MLPQINGRLLSISSDSQSDDWDESAGAGTPKFVGPTGIYYTMTINNAFSESEGALVRFRTDVLRLDETLPVDIEVGDIFTYTDNRGKPHTNRVQLVTNPSLPQIPAGMTYIKVTMEAQRVES